MTSMHNFPNSLIYEIYFFLLDSFYGRRITLMQEVDEMDQVQNEDNLTDKQLSVELDKEPEKVCTFHCNLCVEFTRILVGRS